MHQPFHKLWELNTRWQMSSDLLEESEKFVAILPQPCCLHQFITFVCKIHVHEIRM